MSSDATAVRLVVRAFNEAGTLDEVLTGLTAAGYPVVVVDDGSSDTTWSVARSHRVLCVRHGVNLGPGAAFQTGFAAALAAGARFIVTFDADGQHDVQDIERLVEPLRSGSADVVFGSRFLRREDRLLVPPARRLLLRGAVAVNFLFAGRWLTDAHNGLRAFTAEAAKRIRIDESGFAYASELLAQIVSAKLRLVEVPVSIRYSAHSLSKGQKGWNAIDVVLDLLGGRILK